MRHASLPIAWAADCHRLLAEKSSEPGQSKLGSNKRHYSTIQAILNECTCKYNYAGTAKHVVAQLYEGDNGVCEVLLKSAKWVNDKLGLERSLQFNELVTNQYETAYSPSRAVTATKREQGLSNGMLSGCKIPRIQCVG